MTAPAVRLISLGAGVQSTTVLMLSAEGVLPKVDGAIFADTGWEPRTVYDHLDRLEREVAMPAGIPIYRVSNGNIRDDALDPERRFAQMPLYVRMPDGAEGMGRRQCTSNYKITPINRQVRALLGYPHPTPVPRDVYAEQWVGISRDEFHRAKDSGLRYARHAFPLIGVGVDADLVGEDGKPGWTRRDCLRYLRGRGWESTPKSACVGCPYHGNRAWRDLRDNHPEEWADAVDFDDRIRNGSARALAAGVEMRGTNYLHRARVPLSIAPIDRVTSGEWRSAQTDIFGQISDADDERTGCSPFACIGDEGDEEGPYE
jgi:hypothetical protein